MIEPMHVDDKPVFIGWVSATGGVSGKVWLNVSLPEGKQPQSNRLAEYDATLQAILLPRRGVYSIDPVPTVKKGTFLSGCINKITRRLRKT